MSIYGSSNTWPASCSVPNQSPINLSQSSAKPCDLLCELVIDDVMVPQAAVTVTDEGLVVANNNPGLGSCKFNGEGYTCSAIVVNHPSHHTIENIQADAEVIAIFTNPTGKFLCVSSLVRANSAQTPSSHFFNSFVGFAHPTTATIVNLGENWGLNMMIPLAGSYYVYDGSTVHPDCNSAKWVVFKTMINIDPNDFANLVRTNAPGSRSIQPLGDREVFFNDIASLPGGPMPHDNKTYMRCKRLGKKQDVKPVSAPDVKGEKQRSSQTSGITKFISDMYTKNEAMQVLDVILLIGAVVLGGYAAWQMKNVEFLVMPAMYTEWAGATARYYLIYFGKYIYDSFVYLYNMIYDSFVYLYNMITNPSATGVSIVAEKITSAALA